MVAPPLQSAWTGPAAAVSVLSRPSSESKHLHSKAAVRISLLPLAQKSFDRRTRDAGLWS